MTTPKRMICTCEDVNDVEVATAVRMGCRDLESLKRFTGLATGPCQGKSCLVLARRYLAEEAGVAPAEAGGITLRAPSQPVPLRYLAGDDKEDAA